MMRIVSAMIVSATPPSILTPAATNPVVLSTLAFRSIAPANDAGASTIVLSFGGGIALV